MRLKLIAAVLSLTVSGFAVADYQSEINLGAVNSDPDIVNENYNTYFLDGTYYFNQVKTVNLPLAEAAYMGKNSNVFAGYSVTPSQIHNDAWQGYVVGAEVYIPENFLYVKAGATRDSIRHEHNNDWFTSVGITPIDGLLLTTEYYNERGYDANIHAKYVTELGGNFINLEAALVDTNYGTFKSVGGDFYFDNTFSVGAEISDDDTGTDYSLRTRKFFSEAFSGELMFSDTYLGNQIAVGASFRF